MMEHRVELRTCPARFWLQLVHINHRVEPWCLRQALQQVEKDTVVVFLGTSVDWNKTYWAGPDHNTFWCFGGPE